MSAENIILAEGSGNPCRIKVIGVGENIYYCYLRVTSQLNQHLIIFSHKFTTFHTGGGGGNAINRMVESGTDVQVFTNSFKNMIIFL